MLFGRERFTLKSNLLVVVIDHKTVVNQVAAITKDVEPSIALICHVPTCDETALRAILRDGFQPRHGRLVRDTLYSPERIALRKDDQISMGRIL